MKPSSISPSSTSLSNTPTRLRIRFLEVAKILFVLTKPRLAFFSILTAMAVYGVVQIHGNWIHALTVFLGTSLSAGGALSLNHWWEREIDGLMTRTCSRPLPQKEISPSLALAWSLVLSVCGVGILLFGVNVWAAFFASATILLYGLVYTPLKRRTRWATEVGSISGALPPLIGSAAAGDVLALPGVTLFLILLFWQMPHFYAIGWMYRSDYQSARFPLLPVIDEDGRRTAAWSLVYTAMLFVVSLIPFLLGWFGYLYGIVAIFGGLWFLWMAIRFRQAARNSEIETESLRPYARRLFLASVKYLPVILMAIVVDRIF